MQIDEILVNTKLNLFSFACTHTIITRGELHEDKVKVRYIIESVGYLYVGI